MLDLKKIRLEPETVKTALQTRNVLFDVDFLVNLEERRRQLLQQSDELKNERNEYNRHIGKIRKTSGDAAELDRVTEKIRQLSKKIEEADSEVGSLNAQAHEILQSLPNLPAQKVPVGYDESSNQVIQAFGEPCVFEWEPKTYHELGCDLHLCTEMRIDDSPMFFYQNAGAAFKRALFNFLFDSLAQAGYRELSHLKTVHLMGAYQNTLLDSSSLPLLFASEETDVDCRPLLAVTGFSTSDSSGDILDTMTADIAAMLQQLETPCRIINLCTGKLAFEAAQTQTIELWMPSMQQFVEAVRLSNCTDFSSRNFSIRHRNSPKEKSQYIHTLCGKITMDQLINALWENNQIDDGNISVPTCLQKYYGENIIRKQR